MTQTVDRSVENRERMVEEQIAARGVRDPRVLAAMREVPRELFLREGLEEFAYEDTPLPIESEQTISQPYIVAYMTEACASRAANGCSRSAPARATRPRYWREIAAPGLHRRALREPGGERRAGASPGSATRMSTCCTATAPSAGRSTRRTTRSSSPPAAPRCRSRCASSSPLGGRLVIPVGPTARSQQLVRVTRVAEHEFEEEELDRGARSCR